LRNAFDPEGAFIGTVEIKGLKVFPRSALMRKDGIWIDESDEEGQSQVVKYRMQKKVPDHFRKV
jgi:hypothetical protein